MILAFGFVTARAHGVGQGLAGDPTAATDVAALTAVLVSAALVVVTGLAVLASRPRHRVGWGIAWTALLPVRAVGAIPRLMVSGRGPDLP